MPEWVEGIWTVAQAQFGWIGTFAMFLGLIADALSMLRRIALWLLLLAMLVGIGALAATLDPVWAPIGWTVLTYTLGASICFVFLHLAHRLAGKEHGFLGEQILRSMERKVDKIDDATTSTKEDVAKILKILEGQQDNTSPANQQAQERAVTDAVTAAAKGNSRMAQAVALLQKGDVQAAIPLLRAEAEEKQATARESDKQAATAFRHLGAIAGYADPMAALDAYRQAAALDPDNVEGLFWAGDYALTAGDVPAARPLLSRVLDLTGADDTSFERYGALIRVGDIAALDGDFRAASTRFDEATRIADHHAANDPDDFAWLRRCGVVDDRIGDILCAKGDLNGAHGAYAQALTIAEKLAKAQPEHAEWQRDLSVSHEKIGDTLRAKDDLDQALDAYAQALTIREKLARAQPEHAEWQRDLSVSHNNIGDTLRAKGDLDRAFDAYAKALAIREQLTTAQPEHAKWQRDLSLSCGRVALVRLQKGDRVGARAGFERAREIVDRLLARFPDHTQWRQGRDWYDAQLRDLGE